MASTAFQTQYVKRPAYPKPMRAVHPMMMRPKSPPKKQTPDNMAKAMRKNRINPMMIAQMLRAAAGGIPRGPK